MKKFKQFILPAVIVLLGAGAAFATNAAKVSNSDPPIGHYLDSSTKQCIETTKRCSYVGTNACTWDSHKLYELSGTSCGRMLFEPTP
ncbi:hypothetical protein SDC9_133336 [bioreactor metagenome]|uniref:Uncharacterized protein n=1 Tax=bioreactor metagenome TaxID=1076179 RepID=A0A645DAM9_9ZZZZ